MKITVVGTGYVGLVAGTCLADLGNDVICVDKVAEKVKKLKKGVIPIYEPGLQEMFDINIRQNRLQFTTSLEEGITKSDVIFIAVGTPPGANHEADLSSVLAVAKTIGKHINGYKVVVDKSTVPVGTAAKVKQTIIENMENEHEVDVVSNPEFLREGAALKDFITPDRIVVGTDSPRARDVMEKIYRGIVRAGSPLIITDIESAELIKYASNSFLATKISFMNEVSRLCEKVGADVKKVALGMGLDERIGPRFLQAGIGYGGSCFPKDVKALIQTGKHHGVDFRILDVVEKINSEQRYLMLTKLREFYPKLKGKKIAIWGLSFKPRTDDIREAPSKDIIRELLNEGAEISVFDPIAQDNMKEIYSNINYGTDPYSILDDADALLLLTEWNVFRELDFIRVKSLMQRPLLLDGRNVYVPDEIREHGFTYVSFGRP